MRNGIRPSVDEGHAGAIGHLGEHRVHPLDSTMQALAHLARQPASH
jgi:hypothetical protein